MFCYEMCDWLSSGDWCDVQLFCGGRSFNAHRAVLASASSFLRRILLSCPVEETPTCIFLPDFDLEAFSSVIYYIYNGEVAIQKHKLQKFIDVVKTLDIFVDLQCLNKRNSIESSRVYGNKQLLENSNSHRNSTVFALDSGNNSDQYINIKKGEHNQDVHSQSSQDESEFHDNQARLKTNWINPVLLPSSQSLPTFYFDRQKNFFPRDLCLETYPRNGNTNGHTAGVHAISNDSYRAPASVRLTSKPPREDDALSDVTRKTTDHNSHIGYKENLFTEYNNPNENFSKNGDSVSSVFSEEEVKDSWNNLSSFHAPSPSPQLNIGDQFLPEVPLNNTAHGIAGPSHSTSTTSGKKPGLYPLVENTNAQHPLYENSCLEANQQLSRTSIYNQVLENPWCSRLTFNYRPTFKKMPSIIDDEEVDVEFVNDNNNNTQQPELSSTEELPEKVLIAAEEAPEKVLTSSSQDFKCVICNQVFPDSDRLDEHARQHSSAGRYTCNECGKTFSQLRNFKYHMSVHRGTREFAATCTVCGKYFNDRGYLSSHMKIHKNRKEYKCSMCPKSFNQRVAYNMHVRIHTGVKPHVCSECGKAFSRKMLLKQHQRTHSGERPYACPHCDKRFADRSNMTLHLRLHTGVKPFSCSLCPKSFTKKHHLKSHLNFHTGAKPYSCPRCKLAFTQSSNMRTHYKKCNATEPVADTTSS